MPHWNIGPIPVTLRVTPATRRRSRRLLATVWMRVLWLALRGFRRAGGGRRADPVAEAPPHCPGSRGPRCQVVGPLCAASLRG